MAESDLVTSLADAIQQKEGKPGDRNYRNFNPGNLRSGPGMSGVDSEGYAIFPNADVGMAALRNQIQRNIDRGLNLNEFFGGKEGVYKGFAPKSDKNDPVAYAQFVADRLGISPTEVLGSAAPTETTMADTSDFRSLSDKDLDARIAELQRQLQPAAPTQRTLNVAHPDTRSALRRWAESPTPQDFMHGGIVIPNLKEMVRGGFEMPSDWRTGLADMMGGAGGELGFAGTTAGLMATGAALPEGLAAAGRVAAPYITRGLGALAGGAAGRFGGGVAGSFDPENREKDIRLGGEVGTALGAARGPEIAKFAATNPLARGGLGLLAGTTLARKLHLGPLLEGYIGGRAARGAAPTEKVEDPIKAAREARKEQRAEEKHATDQAGKAADQQRKAEKYAREQANEAADRMKADVQEQNRLRDEEQKRQFAQQIFAQSTGGPTGRVNAPPMAGAAAGTNIFPSPPPVGPNPMPGMPARSMPGIPQDVNIGGGFTGLRGPTEIIEHPLPARRVSTVRPGPKVEETPEPKPTEAEAARKPLEKPKVETATQRAARKRRERKAKAAEE